MVIIIVYVVYTSAISQSGNHWRPKNNHTNQNETYVRYSVIFLIISVSSSCWWQSKELLLCSSSNRSPRIKLKYPLNHLLRLENSNKIEKSYHFEQRACLFCLLWQKYWLEYFGQLVAIRAAQSHISFFQEKRVESNGDLLYPGEQIFLNIK